MSLRVSVVVPCRNEGGALRRCLDALEGQDLPRPAYEVLVVDGHSTDGASELVLRRGHRLLGDPGRGPSAARNVGLRAAKADVIAFTDADCVPRFDWLSRLLAPLEREPTLGGVAGALRLPRDTLLGRLEDDDARVHYHGYITSNVAYRRDVLLEVGGFDERLVCAEDYDLAWRVMDAGYRIHHEPHAIVKHDPPELAGTVATYLRKQLWYARHDVPAHLSAIARTRRAPGSLVGSELALAGLASAVRRAGWTALAGVGVAARSPLLLAAGLSGAAASSARRTARLVAEVGEGRDEALPLALVETAKTLARGAGTLVGLAEAAARPDVWRMLRRDAPALPSAPARARRAKARTPA